MPPENGSAGHGTDAVCTEIESFDLGTAVIQPTTGPVYMARLVLGGHAAPDVVEQAKKAFAAFGPGTTAGGRAEAGWFEVGTIDGDFPVFIRADEGNQP